MILWGRGKFGSPGEEPQAFPLYMNCQLAPSNKLSPFSYLILAAMFSLPTLILKLVSGVALLTLTATITDTLALYLLPNRDTYRKMVYEESPDFKRGSQSSNIPRSPVSSHDHRVGHKHKPE
jgi:hypothetical protein